MSDASMTSPNGENEAGVMISAFILCILTMLLVKLSEPRGRLLGLLRYELLRPLLVGWMK